MITPIEIQSKVFKSGLGYDKKDVDHFLQEILEDYEKLYKENVELQDKLGVVNEGLQYYKTIEKTLQKALVLAEKVAEETKEAAKENAKNIEAEAKNKAQVIVSDARNELKRLHEQTLAVIRQYDIYKAQYKKMAMAQLEILESDGFNLNIANLDVFSEDARINNVEIKENISDKDKLIKKQEEIVSNETKQRLTDEQTKVTKEIRIEQSKETEENKEDNIEEYDESLPHLTEEEIRELVMQDEAEYFK